MKRSSALITSPTFLKKHSADYNFILRKYSITPAAILLTCTTKKIILYRLHNKSFLILLILLRNKAASYNICEKILACKEENFSKCFSSVNNASHILLTSNHTPPATVLQNHCHTTFRRNRGHIDSCHLLLNTNIVL